MVWVGWQVQRPATDNGTIYGRTLSRRACGEARRRGSVATGPCRGRGMPEGADFSDHGRLSRLVGAVGQEPIFRTASGFASAKDADAPFGLSTLSEGLVRAGIAKRGVHNPRYWLYLCNPKCSLSGRNSCFSRLFQSFWKLDRQSPVWPKRTADKIHWSWVDSTCGRAVLTRSGSSPTF